MRERGFNNVGRAAQTDPKLLPYASTITKRKKCWEMLAQSLTGFKLCAHATTSNKVYKRTQHVSSNNVGSCWPGKLCPFARGFTWQKRRKKRVTSLHRQEDSPKTSSRLSVIPLGAKRILA